MNVNITIQHKQGWMPNPDYAISLLSKHKVETTSGFSFSLGLLPNCDYEGKYKSCFSHPKKIEVSFTIPVGYVRSESRSTPSFAEQKNWFSRTIGEYILSIRTSPESQV